MGPNCITRRLNSFYCRTRASEQSEVNRTVALPICTLCVRAVLWSNVAVSGCYEGLAARVRWACERLPCILATIGI